MRKCQSSTCGNPPEKAFHGGVNPLEHLYCLYKTTIGLKHQPVVWQCSRSSSIAVLFIEVEASDMLYVLREHLSNSCAGLQSMKFLPEIKLSYSS